MPDLNVVDDILAPKVDDLSLESANNTPTLGSATGATGALFGLGIVFPGMAQPELVVEPALSPPLYDEEEYARLFPPLGPIAYNPTAFKHIFAPVEQPLYDEAEYERLFSPAAPAARFPSGTLNSYA